jgi:CRISPR-associated protein Cas4
LITAEEQDLVINDDLLEILKMIVSDISSENYHEAIEKILFYAKKKSSDIDVVKLKESISLPHFDNIQKEIINKIEYQDIMKDDHIFSVSQFNTFKNCPRMYEYHYIYRIPSLLRSHFDFGSAVHKVIEVLTKESTKSRESLTIKLAIDLLRREWDPKGFRSKLDEKRSFQEAEEILKVFIEEQNKMDGKILEIEKDFVLNISGINIKGRIDRIDMINNKDLLVFDYKTSKAASSENKLKEDMQLILYSLVIEQTYDKRPIEVGCWYLRKNKRVMIHVTEKEVTEILEQINSIVNQIKMGSFPPKPGWVCKNCDFSIICDFAKK